jgi:type IV secretory pathway VirB10-like protein
VPNVTENHKPPPSPSVATPAGGYLRAKVTGVRRIGARAGIVAAGLGAALLIAIFYGVASSANHRAAQVAAAPAPQIPAAGAPLFDGIPGAIPAAPAHPAHLPPDGKPRAADAPVVLPAQNTSLSTAQEQAAAQNALQNAQAVPAIAPLSAAQAVRAAAAEADAQRKQIARQRTLDLESAARQAAIVIPAPAPPSAANDSAPGAAPSGAPAPATSGVPAQPPSPYQVQAGSIIPATLVSGINSDLPGTVVGQVNQDVYDSRTGAYLLIPAGARLVGRFDAQVAAGQSRVLVGWQRILFPDGSSLDINGLSGTDTAGYAGFTGKVDKHEPSVLRTALSTLIGVGSVLLQPRVVVLAGTPNVSATTPTAAQEVATQAAPQVQQTVAQGASGPQQPPTIEVRPGYLFNVMVSRDLTLPAPYKS